MSVRNSGQAAESRPPMPLLLEWQDGQQADSVTEYGAVVTWDESGKPGTIDEQATALIDTTDGGHYFLRRGHLYDIRQTEEQGRIVEPLTELSTRLGRIVVGRTIDGLSGEVRGVLIRRSEQIQSLAVIAMAGDNLFDGADKRMFRALNPASGTSSESIRHEPTVKRTTKTESFRPVPQIHPGGGQQPLAYRTEHSRSIEDAPKYRAIETLKRLGILLAASDLDLRHGRVAAPGDRPGWSIDPARHNAVNGGGHQNYYDRPSIYVSDRETARDYADARLDYMLRHGGNRADYQRQMRIITSTDTDAVIIAGDRKLENFSGGQAKAYRDAMEALLPSLSSGAPGNFESRDSMAQAYRTVDAFASTRPAYRWLKGMLSEQDLATMPNPAGLSNADIQHVASVRNARQLIKSDLVAATKFYLNSSQDLASYYGGYMNDAIVNTEYIGRFLREAHVIGYKQHLDWTSIGRPADVISLFDLYKVNDIKRHREERMRVADELQPIGELLAPYFTDPSLEAPQLMHVLNNPYAKPQHVVAAAAKVGNFGAEFRADAGNWEKFTLGEHTETVLRNFDENFADKLPVSLLAPMRLMGLGHDIGKAAAAARNDKGNQGIYNDRMSKEFFDQLGIAPVAQDFLRSLIGKGMHLAGQAILNRDHDAARQLRRHGRAALEVLSGAPIDSLMVNGYVGLAEMLVVCDGGAYTSMAVTRDKRRGTYRNAPSFDKSFHRPVGLGKRDLRLKNGNLRKRRR